ncbi:endonuclease/exonuclease/phosphatase family protein [Epilithonimonas mollis]|nr:endonuclease/exonuclease/phosphatase family protein [Epilithonimonas mollis]
MAGLEMAGMETFMFYNVENLYPPDQEGWPSSRLHNWDDYKYRLKIRKINNVFRFIQEDYQRLPSIIGLAEIGAKSVLEDLTDGSSPIRHYEIIYQSSGDSRGLSVALLFDKEKYKLQKSEFLKFTTGDPALETRDVLHAVFLYNLKKFHVFAVHLPSKRNRDVKKEFRNHICKKLQILFSELHDRKEAIILMGDLNDNPDNESVQLLKKHHEDQILSNPFELLFSQGRFSCFHRKKGVLFDQILFTEKALADVFSVKYIGAEIYNNTKLRNKGNQQLYFPARTYSGSRYMGGYSDHFPILLHLHDSHK